MFTRQQNLLLINDIVVLLSFLHVRIEYVDQLYQTGYCVLLAL